MWEDRPVAKLQVDRPVYFHWGCRVLQPISLRLDLGSEGIPLMGDGAALVALATSVTLSSFRTRVLSRGDKTALQASGALKGCVDQCVLVKARVEGHGFPGAGHSDLLRSRGDLGSRKGRESYSGRLREVKAKLPL